MLKLLASMKMGTERIQEIVKSLRTFSRLDEAQVKEADIHEGLDSNLLILQHRLKAKARRLFPVTRGYLVMGGEKYPQTLPDWGGASLLNGIIVSFQGG